MPAGHGVQPGAPSAGGRGIGAAVGRIGRGGNDGRLRCHAGSGTGVSELKHDLFARYSLRITLVAISASR